MASTQVRPIGEIVNSGSFTSPLAQLSLAAAGAQVSLAYVYSLSSGVAMVY